MKSITATSDGKCTVCDRPIKKGETIYVEGNDKICSKPCANEYDDMMD